jgi:hypothetical protein
MGASVTLKNRGLIIYTNEFNIPNIVKLMNILIIKYSLQCKLFTFKNNCTGIYIYRNSMSCLIRILKSVLTSKSNNITEERSSCFTTFLEVHNNYVASAANIKKTSNLNSIKRPEKAGPISIPFHSSLSQCKTFSTSSTLSLKNENFNPGFVTGFTDAEGCFSLQFLKKSTGLGMTIIPLFQIKLHKKDEQVLKDIQVFFKGVGLISYKQQAVSFKVQSLKQILAVIIPYFDRYPLITQKQADYLLFREIIMKMERGEHLNKEGFQDIINIRASLNLGLSENLKTAFPHTKPVARPLVKNQQSLDPY